MGHEVEVVENGKEAVERVRTTEYDLIISNIRLPLMSGLEFMSAVMHQIGNVTPCMGMSGYHDIGRIVAAMRAGATNLLLKPWDMQDLKAVVKQTLARRAEMKFVRDYPADRERRIQGQLSGPKDDYDATLIGFAALLEGDETDTGAHLKRVLTISRLLAGTMGLPADRLRNLELGAMVHDIGMSMVPASIRRTPGPLSAPDWIEVHKHVHHGTALLERIRPLNGADPVVRHHHEKWDGSGYPAGLSGEQIPLEARIFMLADAWDAITTRRHYKEAQSPAHALGEILRCAGTHFDPAVVEVFERIYPEVEAMTMADQART